MLPAELHLHSYKYCRPGTKLVQRLLGGDPRINKLEAAFKQYNFTYSKYSDTINRARANKELADRAWERLKTNDASFGEEAAA